MPTFLIIIISLLVLIFFHELGHFIFAKKYGVRVDEFGIGIPPRIFGKKIGETIYSINWIPLGGFVKLHGEDERIDDERSFSSKPIYQRAIILFAGIAAFFVIAFIVFSAHSVTGVRTVVSEEDIEKGIENDWEIVIGEVVKESPADEAGIRMYDSLVSINDKEIERPNEAFKILEEAKGEETKIDVLRGDEVVSFSLVPRKEYEEDEGSVGMAMLLATQKKYPLHQAPIEGAKMTVQTTFMVLSGIAMAISSLLTSTPLPEGMDVVGPVGIVDIGAGAFTSGISDFLRFLGLITVSLAIFNFLPIPALDGGRLLFLAVEKIKGSPIPEKVEQGLNGAFFLVLISLMIFVIFRDLQNLGIGINFF